jgi:hypothetical protein
MRPELATSKEASGIQTLSMDELSQLGTLRKSCERGSATSCREAGSWYQRLGDKENARRVLDKLYELEK